MYIIELYPFSISSQHTDLFEHYNISGEFRIWPCEWGGVLNRNGLINNILEKQIVK